MKYAVMTLQLLPPPALPGLPVFPGSENYHPTAAELYGGIAEAGLTYVDISDIDLLTYGGESAVRDALQKAGLKVSCYQGFLKAPCLTDSETERTAAAAKEAVDRTERFGAKVMMFVPTDYADAAAQLSQNEMAARFAELLRPVVDYAAEKGIAVVIEDDPSPVFPMCSAAQVGWLLRRVPGLRLVYDTANMLFCGEQPAEFYESLKDCSAHVHLKDAFRNPEGVWDSCVHGTGAVDFSDLIGRMNRDGYRGFGCIELPVDFSGTVPIAERVRRSYDALKRIEGML